MFRIWGKIIVGEKIIKQVVYENDEKYVHSHFFNYLADVCEELDIPTPILTKTHIINFAKFRTVRFLPRDFAEKPEFDKLVLDNLVSYYGYETDMLFMRCKPCCFRYIGGYICSFRRKPLADFKLWNNRFAARLPCNMRRFRPLLHIFADSVQAL